MSRRYVDTVFQAEEELIKKVRAGEQNQAHETKRDQLKLLGSNNNNTSNYKHKIYNKVVGPFLRNASVRASTTASPPMPIIEDVAATQTTDQIGPLCSPTSKAKKSASQNGDSYSSVDHSVSHLNSSTNSIGSNKSSTGSSQQHPHHHHHLPNPFKSLVNKKWYKNAVNGSAHSFYHHHHPQSNLNLPSFSVENVGSSILSPEQLALIWRWLPVRYQILELQLIYSTNIHGCRLMTLMDKIEYYQATLLIALTTTRAIFGAYCSQPWSNRVAPASAASGGARFSRAAFFGNGESFLFELAPRIEKYEWVGKLTHGETKVSEEMFQYADKDKLVVGGGTGEAGAMGLVIDSDLAYGRSGVCDTFRNKVLGNESDFEIAALEVLSFDVGQTS